MKLSDKVILITGAGSGIGEATARHFLDAGAIVWAVDSDQVALRRLVDSVAAPGHLFVELLELTDDNACRRLAARVQAQHPGGLDVLINNAGIGAVGTALQTSADELTRLFMVNVRAPYLLCQLFLPPMITRRSGCIINIASIGGVVGLKDRASYCTTKFAVVGMTKSMAIDHAADQVRINCICPARVETPFVAARIKEYPNPEQAYRELSATQPIGRMARPEEIAAAAIYLADDAASFITGSALIIDGGLSAGR